jgi:CheY-like chemotaxis protein
MKVLGPGLAGANCIVLRSNVVSPGFQSYWEDSLRRPSIFQDAALSVQVDWLGFLAATHLSVFQLFAKESESNYFMFSVALDEAITLRGKCSKTESFQMVELASDLCDRLSENLNKMFGSMAEHCKKHGTTPSVAPLQAECFCSSSVRRLVLFNRLLNYPLSSRHALFLGKLHTLNKLVALCCVDFHRAALDLAATNVALASLDSSWAAMDAAHYDVNTCFRELLVMLKCFLRVLSPDDLALFERMLLRFKTSRRESVPLTDRVFRPSPSIRVLVVDDAEPFRQLVCSILGERRDLQVICEVSDGLEAVQKAIELKPDLILIDIGLPTLNGIETARQICKLVPEARIIFLSWEASSDVVQEALGLGGRSRSSGQAVCQ